VTLGTFAGHGALHSIVVAQPPDKQSISRYQIDIYELPYARGYLQLQFNSPVMFKTVTEPEMNAIIASFSVE
jgi:hypothetical protein